MAVPLPIWCAVLVVMVVLMFQDFAGGGIEDHYTKDSLALINQGQGPYAEITDNSSRSSALS